MGANLGLQFPAIVDAGVEASVSVTTTEETSEGAEVKCPEGEWTCGFIMIPNVIKIKGKTTKADNEACMGMGDDQVEEFEVLMPAKDGPNGAIRRRIEPCACLGQLHWADPGAPPLCPEDC